MNVVQILFFVSRIRHEGVANKAGCKLGPLGNGCSGGASLGCWVTLAVNMGLLLLIEMRV